MINLLLFFVLYFLTYVGFLLGKATKYEAKELRITIFTVSNVFLLISYLILLYYLSGYQLFLLVLPFILYVYSILTMSLYSEYVHSILLYVITFFMLSYINVELLFYVLFVIFAMIMNSSRRSFNLRLEVLGFILLIVLLLFGIIL